LALETNSRGGIGTARRLISQVGITPQVNSSKFVGIDDEQNQLKKSIYMRPTSSRVDGFH
jgi:hypothetical protein